MAAHLIQDLPLALVELGLQEVEQVSHIHGFYQMNDILAKSTNEIQDRVSKRYSPYLHRPDSLARHEDEILANYGFRMCRGMVWYNANQLLDPVSRVDAGRSMAESPSYLLRASCILRFGRHELCSEACDFLLERCDGDLLVVCSPRITLTLPSAHLRAFVWSDLGPIRRFKEVLRIKNGAVEMLLQRIRGEEAPQETLIQPKLVIRESTALARRH
jgi:Family of unknown function (DUF5995)